MLSRVREPRLLRIVFLIIGLLTAAAYVHKVYFYHERDAYGLHQEHLKGLFDRATKRVHQLWLESGKTANFVMLDGKKVNIDPRFGYPSGISHAADDMQLIDCEYVLEQIMTRPPIMVYYFEPARGSHFAVQATDKSAGDAVDENDNILYKDMDGCVYYNTREIPLNERTGIPDPIPLMLSEGAEGIVYKPHVGRTFTFRPEDMSEYKIYKKKSTPELERLEATYSLELRAKLREQARKKLEDEKH
ncbi:hypothetical protein L2734_08700 [Parashewanella spongiae]|nr:hypothetical protein [Parashewanella spongiae]MCL1078244.1 hypothetical protein [Parashewanella spongiae]